MSTATSVWTRALACVAFAGAVVSSQTAQVQTILPVRYSGRAFATYFNTILTGPATIADTGELPPSGGKAYDALLTAAVSGALSLSAEAAVATTVGDAGNTLSTAYVGNLVALPGHVAELRASVIYSEAHASGEGTRCYSHVANLQFGGVTVLVTGQPNQTVQIPGVATLIINEQIFTSSGSFREVKVNALHLIVHGVAEVIVSSARAGVQSTKPWAFPPMDWVTGSGRINLTTDIGFSLGGPSVGQNEGVLVAIDHNANLFIRSLDIVRFEKPSPSTALIEGLAEVNGQSGYKFSLFLKNVGGPGEDFVQLTLDNDYVVQGLMAGGDLQILGL